MTSSRLALLLALPVLCQSADRELFEAVEPHMGTMFRIKLYAANQDQAAAGFQAAFARVAELDDILSDYKPGSELSRVTLTPAGTAAAIGPDLSRILQTGQALALQTGGAFDLTLGPLTHLWRNARKNNQMPDSTALQEAEARSGYRKMHLEESGRQVSFDVPGMQLDAGGIAKGYAADEALGVLKKAGLSQALVAASGDLAFGDAPPNSSGWQIGIDSYDRSGVPFTKILRLQNAAVSTSGDSQQHLDHDGVRYSHVLDAKTGMGLTSELSVTVVAPTGIQADALTKVVSVWGPEKGLAFLAKQQNVSGFLVDKKTGRCFEQGL